MKLARRAGAAAVVLFVGTVSTVYAQKDGGDEKQYRKQEARKRKPDEPKGRREGSRGQPQSSQEQGERQQQRPRQQSQEGGRSPQQQRVAAAPTPSHPQRPEQQARTWQQQRGWLGQGGWQGNVSWERSRAQRWQTDHRTWTQRGGYGGAYIPQVSFNQHFGGRHNFRLHGRPVMYQGYPRFEYSGFSFLMVDPWPEYWSDNWYDFDDVYIDYDDGYYLCNPRYPQVRLAITITL